MQKLQKLLAQRFSRERERDRARFRALEYAAGVEVSSGARSPDPPLSLLAIQTESDSNCEYLKLAQEKKIK
ncbi:hypothetical protein ACLKA6_001722 [Drosophila palustris]